MADNIICLSRHHCQRSWDREARTQDFVRPGVHEPLSPLISGVNHFPSRFMNRMVCLPRKVSYFRDSRMSPWKNKAGWRRNREPVLRPFSFLLYVYFPDFTAAGIWDLRLYAPTGATRLDDDHDELLDWPWIQAMGRENWRSVKGYLCKWLWCLSQSPYKHLDKCRRLKPHLHALKKSARHAKFLAPCWRF